MFDVQNKNERFETLRSTYLTNSDWVRSKVHFQSECSAQIFDWIESID